MLPLSYPDRWRLASIFLLSAVLVLTMAPATWFSALEPPGEWSVSDKWMHAATFALLALWYSGQYSRSSYLKLAVGLLVFGAVIEVCQYFIPYRSAESLDMLADAVGIVCGFLIALLGAGGWSLAAEKRLINSIE